MHKQMSIMHKQANVTGYKKFLRIERIAAKERLHDKKLEILDLGGISQSFDILKHIFHKSKIYTLNLFKEDMKGCENPISGDAENLSKPLKNKEFDIIFATDILEHLMFPDKMLEGCYKHLKKGGLLFLTTPNLACWYNRIFLFFGFSTANYSPSTKYRVGNPFIGRFSGSHKSVFTFKGLKELIRIYKFKILYAEGFEYKELHTSSGRHGGLREAINKIMPNSMKEGILIVARK